MSTFLPNKYARCECSLWEFGTHPVKENYPICSFFEDIMEGGEAHDICKACRHGEECHLKGHEALDQMQAITESQYSDTSNPLVRPDNG